MKLDSQLQGALIGYPAVIVCLGVDAQLTVRQLHPGVPPVVTWSAQWMVGIPLACPYFGSTLGDGLHGASAHMSLLGVLGPCHILGHQSKQWTLSTAVGLLSRQLDQYDVTLWHSIFVLSGNIVYQ